MGGCPMARYSSDLTDAFLHGNESVAAFLGCEHIHLLEVWNSESNLQSWRLNDNPMVRRLTEKECAEQGVPKGTTVPVPPEKRYNAVGIFQAMPETLDRLGFGLSLGRRERAEAFAKLSAEAQLEFAKEYYRPYRWLLVSAAAVYVANFLPALIKHASDPNFVLTGRGGPLGWAFGPNAVFDANGDGKITVAELDMAIRRNCVGDRWREIEARATGRVHEQPATNPSGTGLIAALGSIDGVQAALSRLGYQVGPLDGIAGPRTTAAIVSFQHAAGLAADGIYGALTRAALKDRLLVAA